MNELPTQLEFPLTLRVPRSAFVVVAPEPATVTQKTVQNHFGLPPTMFKQLVRDGLIPAKRVGRLIFASYDDVRRVLTEGAAAKARFESKLKSATSSSAKERPMSIDSAQAYLHSARTRREKRDREKEIAAKAWELMGAYGSKLDDNSPNPKHDEALFEHGERLLLLSIGLQLK